MKPTRRAFLKLTAGVAALPVLPPVSASQIGTPDTLENFALGLLNKEREVTYANYARVVIYRGSGAWDVMEGTASNKLPIEFPICGGGSERITHIALYTGGGQRLATHQLDTALELSPQIQPVFLPGQLALTEADFEEDPNYIEDNMEDDMEDDEI